MSFRAGWLRPGVVGVAAVVALVGLALPARAQASFLDIQAVSVRFVPNATILTIEGVGEYPSDPCGIVELDGVALLERELPSSGRFRITAKVGPLLPQSIHTVTLRLEDGTAQDSATFTVPGGGGD